MNFRPGTCLFLTVEYLFGRHYPSQKFCFSSDEILESSLAKCDLKLCDNNVTKLLLRSGKYVVLGQETFVALEFVI